MIFLSIFLLALKQAQFLESDFFTVYDQYNQVLPTSGFILESTRLRSMMDCASRCLTTPNCTTFFCEDNGTRCQLHEQLPVYMMTPMVFSRSTQCYISRDVKVCPPKTWSYNNGEKCYFFNDTTTLDFDKAKLHCRENNATLLKIDDADQNTFVKNILQRFATNGSYYLGLNDVASPNDFRWSDRDSSLPTYTDWGYDQPTNSTLENCVVYNPTDNLSWYSTSCSNTHFTVCETVPA